jgi:hypothetical protein
MQIENVESFDRGVKKVNVLMHLAYVKMGEINAIDNT